MRFTQFNVIEPGEDREHIGFDLIFCRNLLIYFDDTSRRAAVQTLHDALRPGGYLALGHSDSISRSSTLFEARNFPEALVYQRSEERK